MEEYLTILASPVVSALNAIISQGIVGALLVVSIVANAALVIALIRCYKSQIKESEM